MVLFIKGLPTKGDASAHSQTDSRRFVDQGTAASSGLAYVDSKTKHAILATDSKSWLGQGAPRKSVRITSTDSYSIGTLFVASIPHSELNFLIGISRSLLRVLEWGSREPLEMVASLAPASIFSVNFWYPF